MSGAEPVHDPEDAGLENAIIAQLPQFKHAIVRLIRAVAMFLATYFLTVIQPVAVGYQWHLAAIVGVLALFNLTKWLSVGTLALLLFAIAGPPFFRQ